MKRLMLPSALLALTLARPALCAEAEATPTPTVDLQKQISLEFKDIRAKNLFQVITRISGQAFELDPAVSEQAVTIKLRNVPVQVVLDSLSTYLHVRYRPAVGVNGSAVFVVEPDSGNTLTREGRIAKLERELQAQRAVVGALEKRLAEARAEAGP